jgi:hypothetical protein
MIRRDRGTSPSAANRFDYFRVTHHYLLCIARGHSLMVKFQPSKLAMRVRFPLPARLPMKMTLESGQNSLRSEPLVRTGPPTSAEANVQVNSSLVSPFENGQRS